MVRKASASAIGFPHSGHSGGVKGSVSSSMVFSTSTNGTSAIMPAKRSGRMLATAPISSPPAEAARAIVFRGRGPPLGREVLGRCDEVRERVALLGELAFAIPAPAVFG